MNVWILRFFHWIGRYIQVQLFITLVSLPILVAWGLPISMLSLIGNLFFSPVLVLFLFISSLIFFLQLCGFPCGICVFLLEKIGTWWLRALSIADKKWLIVFQKPNLLWLMLIVGVAFFVIWYPKLRPLSRSISALSLLLMVVCILLLMNRYSTSGICMIDRSKASIIFAYSPQKTVVIDPGLLGSGKVKQSWPEYKLLPEIARVCGKSYIDDYFILKPNQTVFEYALLLYNQGVIGQIHIVHWSGLLPRGTWLAYQKLREVVLKSDQQIRCIGPAECLVLADSEINLELKPLHYLRKQGTFEYPAIQVVVKNQGLQCTSVYVG